MNLSTSPAQPKRSKSEGIEREREREREVVDGVGLFVQSLMNNRSIFFISIVEIPREFPLLSSFISPNTGKQGPNLVIGFEFKRI